MMAIGTTVTDACCIELKKTDSIFILLSAVSMRVSRHFCLETLINKASLFKSEGRVNSAPESTVLTLDPAQQQACLKLRT
jgi:hypothetical protein